MPFNVLTIFQSVLECKGDELNWVGRFRQFDLKLFAMATSLLRSGKDGQISN